MAYPDPPMSVDEARGNGQALISPITGEKTGNFPSFQLTGVIIVSRPMGKLMYPGPERVDSATPHLVLVSRL